MTKREIRQEMKLRSAAYATEWNRDGLADALWSRIESLPGFVTARTVLLYMSLPDEVPTRRFIDKWMGPKRIVLPLVCGEYLELREFEAGQSLHSGYRGIEEPEASAPGVAPDEIDFAVVPGVAFDRSRNRLGRGNGFYDRLMPELNCVKVGVAQNWRVLEKLPTDPWDAALDLIITDKETI